MNAGQHTPPADAVSAAAEVFDRRRPQLTGPEHKRLLPKFNAAMMAALEAAAPHIAAQAAAAERDKWRRAVITNTVTLTRPGFGNGPALNASPRLKPGDF